MSVLVEHFPFISEKDNLMDLLGVDRLAASIAWTFSGRGCGLLFFHSRKINRHPLNIQKMIASCTQLICLSLFEIEKCRPPAETK
jgi:hypothetical protein